MKGGGSGITFMKRGKFNFPRPETNVVELKPVDQKQAEDITLPRSAEEVRINDYNPLILYVWEAT